MRDGGTEVCLFGPRFSTKNIK